MKKIIKKRKTVYDNCPSNYKNINLNKISKIIFNVMWVFFVK